MARPTKPLILHKLEGTARKDRHAIRENELHVDGGDIGDPPDWLPVEAKEEWLRLTSHEQYRQILSSIHRGAFTEYCRLHARMIADAKGKTKMGSSERQTLNSLRMQFGITPASQSKVHVPKAEVPANPWAAVG